MSILVSGRGRTLRWLITRPARCAIVVGLLAFAIYAATATAGLQGYDPETAATAEGFVRTGDFKILPDSVYVSPGAAGEGIPGKGGTRVGRSGLPEPLLMSGFYLVGRGLDQVQSGGSSPRFRRLAILFYNPAVSAVTAALVFLIVLRLRSLRWAIVMAMLFALASIAWPYAKIGMDNTAMLGVALTVTGVVYASAVSSVGPWVLAGIGAGLAGAAKAYEALPAVVVLSLLWRPWREAPHKRRTRLALGVLVPIVVWIVAVGWYDWLRTGSLLKSGASASGDFTIAAPFNAVGFFISPGKGLLFYSPLIALGVLGLVNLRRQAPPLAHAFIGAVVAGTVFASTKTFWTDETWGPRYLVPVAWLLLLPIPWWTTTRARRRVLAVVATLAVCVQLVAISAPYRATVAPLQRMIGAPIYSAGFFGYTATPLGFDPPRWIPQLSPLVIQGALDLSWVGMKLGAPPLTYSYTPYAGPPRHVTLNLDLTRRAGIPDAWWIYQGGLGDVSLLAMLLLMTACIALLKPIVDGRGVPDRIVPRLG